MKTEKEFNLSEKRKELMFGLTKEFIKKNIKCQELGYIFSMISIQDKEFIRLLK